MNRWKRAYAIGLPLTQPPGEDVIEEEQARGIRADCRSFFPLVAWRLKEIPELLGLSRGPADSVAMALWWESHPADALNTLRLYRDPVESWTEEEWACASMAARAAVEFRKTEVEEIFEAGLDQRLESYLRELLAHGWLPAKDARSRVENTSTPMDERWKALYELAAGRGLKADEEDSQDFKKAVHALAEHENTAGTTLAEIHAKCRLLPDSLTEEMLQPLMKEVAGASPYELSAFIKTLQPGVPLRLHGMKLLLDVLEADSPEAAAWGESLRAETENAR